MNPCRTLPIALLALMPLAVRAATIEMHVNGLVCAFCAQGIEKKLRKLPATARSGKFRAWRHVRFRIAEIERVTPPPGGTHTAPRGRRHCMDVPAGRPHHAHRVRAASHQAARGVLLRLPRARHLSLRHVTPHRAGSARTDRRGSVTLTALSSRMRCSQCGKKVAEVVAVARPRPRGGRRSPPRSHHEPRTRPQRVTQQMA